MSHSLPFEVLSDQLATAIGGRRVRAGLFTTFNFDPGFFELQVLPLLFDQAFSQVDKVRLLQLEDALHGIEHLAVYYDRGALAQDGEPARLDYRRIDVRRATGVFHPKLILLLVDEPPDEDGLVYQSLLCAVMSANLTRAGWWENIECVHIEEIRDKDVTRARYPFRRDLLSILLRIERCAEPEANHSSLEKTRRFLKRHVNRDEPKRASHGQQYYTRMFGGEGGEGLSEWLGALRLHRHEWNLEVISPYFDPTGAGPLEELIGAVNAAETRVYLPLDADGRALVTEATYQSVGSYAWWGKLPSEVLSRSGGGERLAPRRVHAKLYRLWHEDGGDVVIAGSVNLTASGHSHGGAGNLEAAYLLDVSDKRWPRKWWLERVEQESSSFLADSPSESEGLDVVPIDFSLRFDWASGELSYRLGTEVQSAIEVRDSSGLPLVNIEAPVVGQWTPCSAERFQEHLKSSSFATVHHGSNRWRVLVREENMAHRPSLLASLTPEEILEYWSLLTAEQRASFLEQHMAFGLELEGLPIVEREKLEAKNTLFDRFAGLYHALGCLERSVDAAIDEGRMSEAVARLFGAKYDSLPAFLEKTLERDDGDPVFRYVAFLSAAQLVERLGCSRREFFDATRNQASHLQVLLAGIPKVRRALLQDADEGLGDFLDWYEPVFLRNVGS